MQASSGPVLAAGRGLRRRQWLSLVAGSTVLSACGGGGGDAEGPYIESFEVVGGSAGLGVPFDLLARFGGGNGVIEELSQAVESGVPLRVPASARSRSFRLRVTSADGRSVARELTVAPQVRGVWNSLGTFQASGHSALLAPDGVLWLIGGYRGGNAISEAITGWDAPASRWIEGPSMRAGRSFHVALQRADFSVLLIGGQSSHPDSRRIEIFDPATRTVRDAGMLAFAREGHQATDLGDGRVLVTGGVNSFVPDVGTVVEIWEPGRASNRVPLSGMAHRRYGHTAVRAAGAVWVIGGMHASTAPYVMVERFDPATESFEAVTLQVAPDVDLRPRAWHAAWVQADGTILVAGGEVAAGPGEGQVLATAWRLDPVRRTITRAPSLSQPRALGAFVPLLDGRLVWSGGANAAWPAPYVGSVELYDPATGGTAVAVERAACTAHTLTQRADGAFFLAGGETRTGLMPSDFGLLR